MEETPILVRVYNRKSNTMQHMTLTNVLDLIPVRPVNHRQTPFGQVILSEEVYLSANIYACITSVLTAIGIVKGT